MMLAIWQMSPMEPPSFIAEPPSLIYFSNTTGTLINCQGQGNPQPNVTWLHHNDRIVMDIQRLRYFTLNNTITRMNQTVVKNTIIHVSSIYL
jgi:hypothetical protein